MGEGAHSDVDQEIKFAMLYITYFEITDYKIRKVSDSDFSGIW